VVGLGEVTRGPVRPWKTEECLDHVHGKQVPGACPSTTRPSVEN
jgi:hypothetical protein